MFLYAIQIGGSLANVCSQWKICIRSFGEFEIFWVQEVTHLAEQVSVEKV